MINVALFGFGRIGQMHAENLTKNKEIKLLYVYEKIEQLSNKAKKPYTTVGIPARISKNGLTSCLCFSVRYCEVKSALPIPSGALITSAIRVIKSVPVKSGIKPKAPEAPTCP